MSDSEPTTDQQSPAPEPETPQEQKVSEETPAKKPRKKRSWRRRFTILLVALFAFALLFRIGLSVAFPIVLKKVAASYGLVANYERFHLGLLGGDVGVGRMSFTPIGTNEPFVSVDYLRATISPLKLITGTLEVWHMEADGVDVHLNRDERGRIAALDRLMGADAPASTPAPPPAAPSGATTQIDLSSPLQIEGFRLHNVRAHLRDRSLNPPLDATVQVDLRVDDVGSKTRPTTVELLLSCDPVLDALRFQLEGRAAGASLEGKFTASVKGLHLKPVAGYLAPMGLRPIADSLAMQADGRIATTAADLANAATTWTTILAASQPASRPADPAPAPMLAGAKAADAVACQLVLSNLAIHADGVEAAAIDLVKLDARKVNAANAAIPLILLDGVRANAARNQDGNVVIAGIEMVPVEAPAIPAERSFAKPQARTSNSAIGAKPFIAKLDELTLRHVRLRVQDEFVEPPSSLQFEMEHLTVADVMVDPDKPDAKVKVSAALAAPGICRQVRLDGTVQPFAKTPALHMQLTANGLALTAVRPYLDLVGLESRLEDASFTASLTASATVDDASGKIAADAHLGDIQFRDGKELFALKDVKFVGVALDPQAGALKVGSIDVTGPKLAFKREPAGGFSGMGFSTKTPVAGRQRNTPHEQPPSEVKLARFELGRFTWKGVKIEFEDAGATPPQTVGLADAGVEVSDLVLDFASTNPPPRPGKIRAWLDAPRIAEKLELAGTITPTPKNLDLDMTVSGRGITAAGVSHYLKDLGIEPLLKDGSLAAHATAKLSLVDGGAAASLQLDGVRYADGDTELAGLDVLKIDRMSIDDRSNTLTVGAIEVTRPRVRVLREAEGTLVAGGVRLLPPPAKPSTPTTQPAMAIKAAPAANTASPNAMAAALMPAASQPSAPPPQIAIVNTIRVQDATLDWTDQMTAKTAHVVGPADIDLSRITLGRESDPVTAKINLRADDIVDNVSIAGQLLPGPKVQGASLKISASGMRGAALQPYLPQGMIFGLTDGRFDGQVEAEVEQAKAGGMSASLKLSSFDWRDGEKPLFKLDQVRLAAPRIDIDGKTIAIDEIAVEGTELDVAKAKDGSLQLLGMVLGVAPAEAIAEAKKPAAPEKEEVPPAVPATQPAVAAAPASSEPPARTARPKTLPRITLNKLDLNVRRLTYRDLSAPMDAKPLSVADLRLHNLERITLLGEDPTATPPVKLELTGKVDPLIEKVGLQLQLALFAQQPALQADLVLSGIRGDGIFALAPNLRSKIDATGLKDGDFRTHAELQLKVDRRGPTDVAFFGRPFDIEQLVVKGTAFRAAADGPVLAGLEELRVEDARVKPAAGSVRVKTLDLTKPTAQIVKEKDGIHACGLVILSAPAPATQPSGAQSVPAQPGNVAAEAATPVKAPGTAPGSPAPVVASKSSGELRVDKFTINGVEAAIEDRSVEPPVLLPITSLDLEARDISSLAQEQNVPIRFVLSASAGKVNLPKKIKGGVIGAVGDVANLLGGQKTPEKPEFEERELFAQVAASGRIALYPKLTGWAKANVSGFEVAGIAGLARQSGVSLSHGTFDVNADVRLKDGTIELIANPSFTDLNITEPENGPVVRYLKLGAPLDKVIGVLESADKSITVPLNVKMAEQAGGGSSLSGIESSIVNAVGQIVVKAIASAPVKVVSGVTDLVGLDKLLPGQKPKIEQPIVLSFPAGATGLEPSATAAVAALADRMRNEPDLQIAIKHELGGGDERIASTRANPPAGDVSAIAASLHHRKLELARMRSDLAAEARVRLAAGGEADANAALQRLRVVDRDAARTEDALDRAYDMLRPGADRQATSRTRAAALSIARERLDVIRQSLAAAKVPDLNNRLKPASPQFNPGDNAEGGTVTITLVHTKK